MRFRVLAVAAVAFVLAGCGEKTDYVRIAETEGVSVDVGDLVYQVQISRYLNPGSIEDFQYLEGLPQGTPRQPAPGEIWFGVWMRVKNYTDFSQQPSTHFVIRDTEGDEFFPTPLAPSNPFAYRPVRIPPHQVLPTPESAAANGPIQGSLILFKLKTDALQNRPLVLHIEQPGQEGAEVDLDL